MTDAAYRGEHVRLDVVALAAGTTRTIAPADGQEGALVLVEGDVSLDGEAAKRTSVFDQRATAVYLPPGSSVTVEATTDTELVFTATVGYDLADTGEEATVVHPDGVVVQPRGKPGWQRDVHDLIADAVPARHLLVGETFNEPGQWSSFPPHKHDGADGEPQLEEVYYYRFDRPGGFGFQGLYEANGQAEAVFLEHGSIVGIPRGYHPVCAAPGYRLYYLWALVGDHRQLAMHEDPVHRWLNDR
ncbi:MAG TPA: 5-deoxy-glucuronate isomerase [Acidimicrobiia bacterium]|jgi:5-deoxy-glucuronate isomerase|nr:5-deoxy-glucuronate isomerase [Acidimicrobiia bacterium]